MRLSTAGAIGAVVAIAAGAVLALSGDLKATSDQLTLLQFNICGHACNGGGLAVAVDIERAINARRPFAVTLNEVCQTQYDSLRVNLDAYQGRFDPTGPRCRNGARYGNAVLLRTAITDFVGTWELPSPVGDENRRLMCLRSRVSQAAQAPTLVVCVTHISNHTGNIADQVMAVAAIVNDLRGEGPVLVGGDFNTDPSDARMNPIYSSYYESGRGAFREADAAGPASRSALDARAGSDLINESTFSRHKLDYIFFSDGDWTSMTAEVDDSIRHSDHKALWASATLRSLARDIPYESNGSIVSSRPCCMANNVAVDRVEAPILA